MSAELPLPESFSDPRRARLHEQLARLGRVPAALYRDACRLFDGVLTADAAFRVAGHLERELLGSVKDVLLPFDYSRPKASDDVALVAAIVKAAGGAPDVDTATLRKLLDRSFNPKQGGNESALDAILRSMGIPADDDIVTLWKELDRGLHAIAHRSHLDELPALDVIRDQWARFERLLSRLLERDNETPPTHAPSGRLQGLSLVGPWLSAGKRPAGCQPLRSVGQRGLRVSPRPGTPAALHRLKLQQVVRSR